MVKLNQISSQYIGKIMYALFFMSILETLVSFMILSPAMRLIQSNTDFALVKASTIILALLAVFVWLTFQFGFAIMLLQMTRRKNTNLGYIFIGFKRFNPAGKVILSFGFLVSILAIIARFIAKFIFLKIYPDFSFEMPDISIIQTAEQSQLLSEALISTFAFIGIFLGILFILGLIILIRFVFVFQLHFDNPNMKIPLLFKKSATMMNKNVLRLILFALRAGGKQLLIAIIIALLTNFIPDEKESGLAILGFILNIVYFINLYTAMVRIYLTVPVMYEEITNPTQKINESEAPKEIMSGEKTE